MGRYLDIARTVKVAENCEESALRPILSGPGPKGVLDTGFVPDRECEKSELCEKRSADDGCEISEKRSASDIRLCPLGGHAVLLEGPEGVPEVWAQGVADLLAIPPHPDWPDQGWKALQQDALTFLQAWAAQAHRMGWDARNLFSIHTEAPHARLDGMGLVPLLGGRPVIALTEDSAVMKGPGGMLTYRRRKVWPVDCCLIWELEPSS